MFAAFPSYPLALEVRHASWNSAKVLAELTERGVVLSTSISRVSRLIRPAAHATAAVGYVRLHGRNYQQWFRQRATAAERYDYFYSEAELRPWVARIAEIASRPGVREVYAVANNHHLGKAPANAGMIKGCSPTIGRRCRRRCSRVTRPSWVAGPPRAEQVANPDAKRCRNVRAVFDGAYTHLKRWPLYWSHPDLMTAAELKVAADTVWTILAGVPGVLHERRVRPGRGGTLPTEERDDDPVEELRRLRDLDAGLLLRRVRADVLRRRACLGRRAGGCWAAPTTARPPAPRTRGSSAPSAGPASPAGEVPLRARVLRDVGDDRLRLGQRAHEVQLVPRVLADPHGGHVPDRRSLGLGRRVPCAAGMRDFSGSTVVHSFGGWAALAGVIVGRARASAATRRAQADDRPRSPHGLRVPGRHDPLARLVRLQSGLDHEPSIPRPSRASPSPQPAACAGTLWRRSTPGGGTASPTSR